MSYSKSLYYFAFLPIVLLLYQLFPKKARWIVLLGASYTFFLMLCKKDSRWLIVYLIGATLFTYIIALLIRRTQNKCKELVSECQGSDAKKKIKSKYRTRSKIILIVGILGLTSCLIYTHYLKFFVTNINLVMGEKFIDINFAKILAPMGISFYTMEAIGYLVDVFWEKVEVCKHPFKIALFLGFFPQIMQGPIASYSQTADKLWSGESVKLENIKKGYLRIFWGLFKVLLITARLSKPVKEIFTHYQNYSGIMIVFAAIAYTVQLYSDFSGGIDIFIGSAQLFGVELPENFKQPFASKGPSEFWQRWHISLGAWFKAYIFYPVSVSKMVKKWNKFAKKKFSKYIAKVGVSAMCLLPVWMCNGLWHGAGWSFMFYGVYYFVILLVEVALDPVKKKLVKGANKKGKFMTKLLNIGLSIKTLIIIFVGELFFNAKGFIAGCRMFKSMFTPYDLSKLGHGKYVTVLGLDKADYVAVLIGILGLAIVGYLKEHKNFKYEVYSKYNIGLRWAMYYTLIFSVIIFGAYGVGYQAVDLIYAAF